MTPAPRPALLARLADQFAAAVADGSEVHEVGGFRVHLWRAADPFYRNVAIPVRPEEAGRPDGIAAMRDLFEEHGRVPRLEFFAELWPGLAQALEEAGFVAERTAAVMARGPAVNEAAPVAQSARLLDGRTPLTLLRNFLAEAAEAFGEPGSLLAAGELDRFADGLRRGVITAAAALAEGMPVSGASLIHAGRVAELAGVWTGTAWRRRGLARACCRLLLGHFFRTGGELAWLSAGDEGSEALYRGLGFRPCGTQLNYAFLPAAGPSDTDTGAFAGPHP